MPLYKFAGKPHSLPFRERHAGHEPLGVPFGLPRLFRRRARSNSRSSKNSNGFNFDTQIIIQMHDAGMRIAEVPIPTYYGDEICYVDGMAYAADVTKDVITYRLQKAGFGDGSRIALNEEYQLKPSDDSSHGRITKLLQCRPPSRILDLGLLERAPVRAAAADGSPRRRRRRQRDRRGAGTHGCLLQGRSQRGNPVGGRSRLRHRPGWRTFSSTWSTPVTLISQVRDVLAPTGTALYLRAEHRALVSAVPLDPRDVRLRPAWHPRLHPSAGSSPGAASSSWSNAAGSPSARIEPVGLPLDALGVEGTRARSVRLADRLLVDLLAHHVRLPVHRRGDARQDLTPRSPAAIRSGRQAPAREAPHAPEVAARLGSRPAELGETRSDSSGYRVGSSVSATCLGRLNLA